jgi:hypothetical protein
LLESISRFKADVHLNVRRDLRADGPFPHSPYPTKGVPQT